MTDGALWDLFCHTRERAPGLVDRYGRVPSFAGAGQPPFEPVVSRRLIELGFRPRYPNDAPFAVCLSHDIDALITSPRERAGSMRRGQIPVDFRGVLGLLGRKVDPRYAVDRLLKVEDALGVKAAYYFQALVPGDEDFNYTLDEVAHQWAAVRDQGHEIGLHGGHRAHAQAEVLAEERDRMHRATGLAPAGYRNHFLRFRLPATWKLLAEQGFVYDTTYGWSDLAGFRNGMCHPFRPTDPITGRREGILEIPLIVMDATFMFNMKLDEPTAWELCTRLMDRAQENRGVLTVLWHNNYMHTAWGALYERIVRRAREAGAWFATGAELAAHWSETGELARMEALMDQHLRPAS